MFYGFSTIFLTEGGLISERFSLWYMSQKNQITILSTINQSNKKMLKTVICHLIFGHLNQNENISEIKPPLSCPLKVS